MNNTYFYQKFKNLVLFVTSLYFLLFAVNTFSQTVKPSDLASCTVTAMNRTAPVNKDFSFEIYNMPGAGVLINSNGTQVPASPYRARAVCSDGTVGQTKIAFPTIESLITLTGEIIWGQNDPIPSALKVTTPKIKLLTAETTLLDATAIFSDGASRKYSDPSTGVMFATTNPLLATVDVNGEVLIKPEFASGSSARVLAIGSLEGVAGSVLLQLGPLGGVTGKVLRADGVSLANGVQVTLIRDQPREQAGTVQTDGLGNFNFDEISAGSYSISVFDPVTKARGVGYAFITSQDETSQIEIKLNGVASLKVKVVDATEKPIPSAEIGFSSMSGYNDIRFLKTDNNGWVVLDLIPAGYFVVTGRDAASRLSGVEKGKLVDGEVKEVVIKLQPVASFMGKVFAADGTTIKQGVQVRLISATKGLISQTISDVDGGFEFDTVTLADAPYTLDAMLDGRVRGREQGLILPVANQVRQQNIIFVASGQVNGKVLRANGQVASNIAVSLQSLIGQKITLITKANENGEFRFDVVPIGEFRVQATDGGQVAIVKSEITSEDEVKNLQLTMASVGLKGRVFNRDKISPVGAGVKVFLQPGNQETVTDSDGYYGFVITQPSDYVVEVKDELGNRGRTSIKISSIDPTNPSVANVAYIGIGRVEGVVTNASGVSQPNVEVTLNATSVFGYAPSLKTATNTQGQFIFENQYVGKLTLTAAQSTTGLRGQVSAELKNEAEVLVANIDLAATASIAGTIYDNLGSTVIPNANLILSNIYTGKTWQMQADAQGKYLFSNLPLGSYSLKATKELDGDTGVATVQVNTLNEQKVLNLRLQGLGNLQVNVKKADGTNAAGATVTLSRAGYYRSVITNEAGIAVFGAVPAGVYSASTSVFENGQFLNVSVFVRLPAQANVTAVIKLPSPSATNPSGTMTVYGTVFKNGSPAANMLIIFRGLGVFRLQTSDASGNYKFDSVPVGGVGQVQLLVSKGDIFAGNLLGVKYFTPQVVNEDKRIDLTLIETGNVQGVITDINNKPMVGLKLVLSKNDNTYTGSWTESTNEYGQFNFKEVTAGSFTLRAYNLQNTLVGQVQGLIKTEGEVVLINFKVFDNLTGLPVTLNDANEMSFILRGNGELTDGINGALDGITNSGTNDQGINRLEILSKSNYIPFTNNQANSARKFENNQSFEVFGAVTDLPEIKVKRQTYIPKTGYFARHLEVLENTGAQPAIVSLRLTSNISAGNGGARIVDTSNNDTILDSSNNSKLPDNWLIVDDTVDADPFLQAGSNIPAVAILIDGVNGEHNASELKEAVLGQGIKLQWVWKNIKVEPGQRVAFMHFTVQQLNQLAARLSVQRLEQLPHEALEGLLPEDLSVIKNFVLPNNEPSTLEALPSTIDTEVIGNVYASDGLTKLSYAKVVFKSNNPFFGRTLITHTNSIGSYSFKSYSPTYNTNSVAIAQSDFNLKADFENVTSNNNIGYFEENSNKVKKDIILNGSSVLKGNVYRKNGTIITSGRVTVKWFDKNGYPKSKSTFISNLGTYAFNILEPLPTLENTSQYSLTAENGRLEGFIGGISLIADNVTVKDIYLESTGVISGIVKNGNTGDPIVNQYVYIKNLANNKVYEVYTDTSGRFMITDLPLGEYLVDVDLGNGNNAKTLVEVFEDKTSEISLVTQKLVKLNLEVKYTKGTAAANSLIYRYSNGYYTNVGKTSDKGIFTIELPTTNTAYNFKVEHPQNSSLYISKNITLDGGANSITENLILPPAGTLKGYIKLLDGVPVSKELVRLINQKNQIISQNYSDISGIYEFNGVTPGNYLVSVVNNQSFLEGNTSVELIEDGQLIEKDIFIQENRVALPVKFLDSNKFNYEFSALNSYIDVGLNYSHLEKNFSLNELTVSGHKLSPVSFGTYELNRRQVVIKQPNTISGINITRKVFLPQTGSYAARYLEIFENPTTQDINLDVQIENKLPLDVLIKKTSSGENLSSKDTWVVFDDKNSADPFLENIYYGYRNNKPAYAFVMSDKTTSQKNSLKIPVVSLEITNSNNILMTKWDNLIVPANGKIILMHFIAPQIAPENAQYAAERLNEKPSEAIFGLTETEISSIKNFDIPHNGVSVIPDLPDLYGAIQGIVFEGNGETPVSNTILQIQSTHPLFSRIRTSINCGQQEDPINLITNSQGFYSLVSNSLNSIPLPVGWGVKIGRLQPCRETVYPYNYSKDGLHPQSLLKLQTQESTITSLNNPSIKDLKFDSGIIMGTVVGGLGFQASSGSIELNYPESNLISKVTSSINNIGQYEIRGLPQGNFDLTAKVNLDASVLYGNKSESISVGVAKIIDINLDSTGGVQGVVTLEGGESAEGYTVGIKSLDKLYYARNSVKVDRFSKFVFYGLPIGNYELSVYEPRTEITTKHKIEVFNNQLTNQDIVVKGSSVGLVKLKVIRSTGLVIPNAKILLKTIASDVFVQKGWSDATGWISLTVPMGEYTIEVIDPSHSNNLGRLAGVMTLSNLTQVKSIALPIVVSGKVQLLNSNNENLSELDTFLHSSPSRKQKTDVDGWLTFEFLPAGIYTISTIDKTGNLWIGNLELPDQSDYSGQLQMLKHPYPFVGVLSSPSNKQLYTIPDIVSGDLLSVWIRGKSLNNDPSIYGTEAKLLNPITGDQIVNAIGFDKQLNHYQNSSLLDYQFIEPGDYKLVVQTPAGWDFKPGAFQLEVSKNYKPIQLVEQFGTIKGVVKSLGQPLKDYWLKVLSGKGTPFEIEKQVKTNSAGEFELLANSVGDYELKVVSSVDDRLLISTSNTLNAGETKIENISFDLPVKTIKVKVKTTKLNLMSTSTVSLYYEDQLALNLKKLKMTGWGTEFESEVNVTGIGNNLLLKLEVKDGDKILTKTLQINLIHWNEEQDYATLLIEGEPQLSGIVKDEQGTTFPYTTVSLLSEDGQVIQTSTTDSSSVFLFNSIPTSTNFKLAVEDFNYGLIEKNINLAPNVSEVHDLIFTTKVEGTLDVNPDPFIASRIYSFKITSILDDNFVYYETNRVFRNFEYSNNYTNLGLNLKLPPGDYFVIVDSAFPEPEYGYVNTDSPLCGKSKVKVNSALITTLNLQLTVDGTDNCWGVSVPYVN